MSDDDSVRRRHGRRDDPPNDGRLDPGPIDTGPIDIPGEIELPAPGDIVRDLDAALPLTMFPVRLATRLRRPAPEQPPTELWVRIFPDLVHADGHLPELSAEEITLGHAYWDRLWRAGDDQLRRDDTHRWVVAQLGAPRTAWVIGQTAPVNPDDAPRRPVASDQPLPRPPEFPKLVARTVTRPTLARMLPDVWHVTVRHSSEFVTRAWSKPVRRDLAMAPNLAEIPADGHARDLLANQDLWWMADFDAAVDAGMGVRMPWNPPAGGPFFATEVVVFGVRGDNAGADSELTGLLDAHRFTSGVEIVPQGTPTNNTDTVIAGFTTTPADLDGFLDRQTTSPRISRPQLSPARLGTTTLADAASIALGLDGANAFDHTEHASLRTGSWARDMNRTLWPATFDYFLRHALATGVVPAVADDDRAWLAGWCRDWVRAGGFLPAFRVGTQPYGLLPVARRPRRSDLGSTRRDQLVGVLLDLLDDWNVSLGFVANFSAARGGLFGEPPPTPDEEAVRLASVLGAVPHPTGFRLRPATVRHDSIAADWTAAIAEMERLLLLSHNNLYREAYEIQWKAAINAGELDAQGDGLDHLRDYADGMIGSDIAYSEAHRDAAADARDYIDSMLRPMIAAHQIRAETRQWDQAFSVATLPTVDDPPLWYVEYGEDNARSDGTFPTLRLVPDKTPAAIATTLRDFAADARRATSIPRPGYVAGVTKSLFEKLVEHGVMRVPGDQAEELALGLEGLATMLESGDVADPVGELTRLLRESLGLATHRLDAWMSSLADEHLASLRATTPTGMQVGGYGWVVNLESDESGGADSHGFIHAPSLDHAATAAVLRSAWLNYAADAQDAPFGVDVSSDRVRRAQWLLEGVRNGVDLGELLGAKFERRLHDAGRSHLIADVRQLVLDATGRSGEPARAIVDGLALAVAYSESTVADPVFDAIEQWRTTLPGYPADGMAGPLHATVADLDSTADLLTTQSVHSVLKGNLAEAAATLSVAGAGDAGIPQLRVPAVHRQSQVVTHRVVAVLPPPPPPADASATPSLLSVAEPALAHWLARLLPPPAAVDITVELGAGTANGRWEGTLEMLGLGAVEVVALAAGGGELGASMLGSLVAARARMELGAVTNVPADLGGALPAVAIAAGSLRSLLGAARPLRGDDLAATSGLPHDVDVDELDDRRLALATVLDALGRSRPEAALLRSRFADLATLDPGGLLAALTTPDRRDEHLRNLLQKAARNAKSLLRPLPGDWAALTPGAQAEHFAGRIRDAIGVSIPVLQRQSLAHHSELASSLASSPRRLGSPVAAMSWLLEAGRVHQGAGLCAEALDLVEVVNPAARIPFQVAQLPDVDGEPWVAVEGPTGAGGRLDLLFVTDAAAAMAEDGVAGLIFDGWSEPIPGRRATTGVAVHFDRPGAQPPQAVLLAMPPEEGAWTVEHLERLLLETLEMVAVRAVGPETLNRLGHTLPAVGLEEGAAVSVVPEPVDGPIVIEIDPIDDEFDPVLT